MLTKPRLAVRRIERASALLVGLLAAKGELPRVPAEIASLAEREGAVKPTEELAEKLTWLLAFEGPAKVVGVAAYLDRFDYHTMRNVREITTIFGSRRAVVDLLRMIRTEAQVVGRTPIGALDRDNTKLGSILRRLCARSSVVVWESP